ncbi:tripartite tricarboxylate transporter substrate binding protein (plasmid) [Polaromonas sp. P1-6]|nr:tripartite tricarboxylate transporter substrate binding protein [Polaromonas sp. P1-6]
MISRRFVLRVLAAACTSSMAIAASAQAFPTRNITLVVPFPAGGITDQIARTIAVKLQASIGKPVIVDNKPGAGGQIAAAQVKQAEADGHTIFVGATEMFAINPGLFRKFNYDPLKDFTPLTALAASSLVLVVPQASPVRSLPELVAQAKNKKDGLNFASQGIGSIGHLLGEMFKNKVGGTFSHVAYKGSAPALQDVMSGQVDMMFDPVLTTSPLIAGGKLRALAIAAPKRSSLLPDVPTLTEQGMPGIDAAVWFGAVVKAGTPTPIVARLNEELVKALKNPEVTKRLHDQGLDPMPMSPQQFADFMKDETGRWGALVKSSGATVD